MLKSIPELLKLGLQGSLTSQREVRWIYFAYPHVKELPQLQKILRVDLTNPPPHLKRSQLVTADGFLLVEGKALFTLSKASW